MSKKWYNYLVSVDSGSPDQASGDEAGQGSHPAALPMRRRRLPKSPLP